MRNLRELRRLDIGGGYKQDLAIDDLRPLEDVPKLRTLRLSHSTKINRLPKLRHLERFECFRVPRFRLEELANFPSLRQFSRLSSDLSDGIIERLKAIAPNVEWTDSSHSWEEVEQSAYNTYFG